MIYRIKSTGETFPTFEEARASLAASHLTVRRDDDHAPRGSTALRWWTAYDDATGFPCDRLDQLPEPAAPSWQEVDRETAYGHTVRLSRSIRVF